MSGDYTYRKKWQLDRLRGIERTTDPEPARRHIADLRARGVTHAGIADAAGLSTNVITSIRDGQPTIRVEVARRILAVDLADIIARSNRWGFVPAIGSRRRIQALLAIGWRHGDITPRIRANGARTHSQLVLHQAGTSVARVTADAVRAVYDELWATPGPSTATRKRAAALGYAPPMAWDDDTIDDPAATPAGIPTTRPRTDPDEWLADVAEMAAQGRSIAEVCARIGSKPDAVERRLYRYGRADLWRALRDPDTRTERTA